MLANIKNSTDGNTEIEKVDESLNTTLTAVDEDQLILKSANKNLPQKLGNFIFKWYYTEFKWDFEINRRRRRIGLF